jgi:hypothetical protein
MAFDLSWKYTSEVGQRIGIRECGEKQTGLPVGKEIGILSFFFDTEFLRVFFYSVWVFEEYGVLTSFILLYGVESLSEKTSWLCDNFASLHLCI